MMNDELNAMQIQYTQLKKVLRERLKKDEPLAPFTTFKIGGPADYFFEAKIREELIAAVRAAKQLLLPWFILGGGSNLLIGDKGFRGLVIKNNTGKITLKGIRGRLRSGKAQGKVYVEAESGVNFNQLVRFAIEEGLGGLEMHLGLPGTVGGAIFMNSKWTKPVSYVGDAVYQADLLSEESEVRTVPAAYFLFGYDKSRIQQTGEIVLSVVFALEQTDKNKLWETANASIKYRRMSQPQGVFSPGCTFRNLSQAQALSLPTPNQTVSAGFLIDHAGLAGYRIGDAQISLIHANFIVNQGHARAGEVIELINLVKAKVKAKYGVSLEEEIIRVGEF